MRHLIILETSLFFELPVFTDITGVSWEVDRRALLFNALEITISFNLWEGKYPIETVVERYCATTPVKLLGFVDDVHYHTHHKTLELLTAAQHYLVERLLEADVVDVISQQVSLHQWLGLDMVLTFNPT